MAIVTSAAPAPETSKTVNGKPPSIPEVPVAEAAPEVIEEKKLSPQYAQLARRERELRMKADALKAKEAAWEASQKAKDEEYASKYVPKDKFQKDPLAAIYEMGLTKDQLIDMLLNGAPQVDPKIQTLEQRQADIEAKIEAQSKAQAEQQTKAYEQAVTEIRKQATALVAANEDFVTIKEANAAEAVVELIKQTYDTEGTLLSVEDAAKQVEDYLFEEAQKVTSYTKIKAKLAPKVEEVIAPDKKPTLAEAQAKAPTPQIKTLTNAATAVPSKPLSAMSRKERAILAFKGQLP